MKFISEKLTKSHLLFTRNALTYLKGKLLEFEVLAIVIVFLSLCKRIPYVNIFINDYISLFIIITLVHYLFKISTAVIIMTTLFLFIPSYLYIVSGNVSAYEQMGNLIYFLLWYICIVIIFNLWKQQKQ